MFVYVYVYIYTHTHTHTQVFQVTKKKPFQGTEKDQYVSIETFNDTQHF